MKNIIDEIKKKKELSGLSDKFVESILEQYLKKNKFSLPLNKKSEKIIVKEIRSNLRNYTGQYQLSQKSRQELLDNNKIEELLKTHSSTKERLDFYPALKSKINKLNPKSILDLGCGLNPVALASNSVKYYACDIQEAELNLIKSYFKLKKIRGKVFFCDLREPPKFPYADLCLIFKVLDIIESGAHKKAKELILNLKCKNMIVSFSTKKLSGKKMNRPRRFWFEEILEKNNLFYETFKSENEIFYLISFKQ